MGIGLLLVYFIYGLAFWTMGLAVFLESGRAPTRGEAFNLRWLALFGMLHGSHEWLEAYLRSSTQIGSVLPGWIDWLRLALLGGSFCPLLAYAAVSLARAPGPYARRSWFVSGTLVVLLAVLLVTGARRASPAVPLESSIDAAARYLLAVPSAMLAGLAMAAQARQEASRRRTAIASSLRLVAIGFGLYAASQLVVLPLPWFPANFINQDRFLALLGIPIQAVRAAMAGLISIGLLSAMEGAERDRQRLLVDAHQARLAALGQQDALRRDLLRHVVRSQEDERSRIARELHDEVAQLLTAFSLELASLRSKLRRRETVAMVARLQDLSKQMSESLYHLVRDLRPPQLDSLGLVPALQALASPEYGLRGLDLTLRVSGPPRPLDSMIETVLFRVAQEAISNVARHAHSAGADLELHFEDQRVLLLVRDEGCGFDPAMEFRPPRGWGLVGMRERVESLGGRLDLVSASGRGTTVQATIPLPLDRDEDNNG